MKSIFTSIAKGNFKTKMITFISHSDNHQRNCWDKSEKLYIVKLIAQFLSPYPSTNVEIEQKPQDIVWLNEFNFGEGVGRVFSIKLGLYLKFIDKFNLSQLFLWMIVWEIYYRIVINNRCNSFFSDKTIEYIYSYEIRRCYRCELGKNPVLFTYFQCFVTLICQKNMWRPTQRTERNNKFCNVLLEISFTWPEKTLKINFILL